MNSANQDRRRNGNEDASHASPGGRSRGGRKGPALTLPPAHRARRVDGREPAAAGHRVGQQRGSPRQGAHRGPAGDGQHGRPCGWRWPTPVPASSRRRGAGTRIRRAAGGSSSSIAWPTRWGVAREDVAHAGLVRARAAGLGSRSTAGRIRAGDLWTPGGGRRRLAGRTSPPWMRPTAGSGREVHAGSPGGQRRPRAPLQPRARRRVPALGARRGPPRAARAHRRPGGRRG